MKFIKPRSVNESNSMESIIPDSIWELNSIFQKEGHKLYVVGGAVRDFLNNEKPKDFDLATDAEPQKVIDMLKPHFKVKDEVQGVDFAVVVVYTEDEPDGMEIATFREDVYGDKLGKTRNPDIKFTTIEKDVERRDLTFNGLFFDLEKKEIIDLVGGQKDLENKITRFVGKPADRIIEDPLRILRLLRFTTRYNFTIEEKTANAIKENGHTLSIITKERIWDSKNGEVVKAFKQAKDFQDYVNYVTAFALWDNILPNLEINSELKSQINLPIVVVQLVKGNSIKSVQKNLTKSKLSTDLINQVVFMLKLLDFNKEDILKFHSDKVRSKTADDTIEEWIKINGLKGDVLKFTKFVPTVSGEEVMKKFDMKPSRELGDKIKELEVINFEAL